MLYFVLGEAASAASETRVVFFFGSRDVVQEENHKSRTRLPPTKSHPCSVGQAGGEHGGREVEVLGRFAATQAGTTRTPLGTGRGRSGGGKPPRSTV